MQVTTKEIQSDLIHHFWSTTLFVLVLSLVLQEWKVRVVLHVHSQRINCRRR